jgi:hypothetical protein
LRAAFRPTNVQGRRGPAPPSAVDSCSCRRRAPWLRATLPARRERSAAARHRRTARRAPTSMPPNRGSERSARAGPLSGTAWSSRPGPSILASIWHTLADLPLISTNPSVLSHLQRPFELTIQRVD